LGNDLQPKGCISEVYFGYNTILEVYPHFTADINELSEIRLGGFKNLRKEIKLEVEI